MEILKDAITSSARGGYLSLQIPEIAVRFNGGQDEVENIPDDWVCRLKSCDRPAVGKESGFLYLTRKGYEANKPAIRAAFEQAIASGTDRTGGIGWPAFEQAAAFHFSEVERRRAKLIAELTVKLEQANSFVV